MFDDALVGELLFGFLHDAFDLGIFVVGWELVEVECLVDGPAEAFGGEVFEEEAVAGIFVDVEVLDGVFEAAGGVCDGKGAVAGADHLGEAAGFEG